MTATETKRTITRTETQAADLAEKVAALEARRSALLLEIPTVTAAVRSASLRDELEQVDRELRDKRLERGRLADTAEALRASLPDAAALATAEARAEELAAEAAEAAGDALDSWTVIVAALSDLSPAAARYSEAMQAQRAAVQKRRDTGEQYALDLAPLDLPASPGGEEVQAALRLLTAAQQAVRGGGIAVPIDGALEALVEPLRQRLETAEEAAEEVPGLPFDGEAAA